MNLKDTGTTLHQTYNGHGNRPGASNAKSPASAMICCTEPDSACRMSGGGYVRRHGCTDAGTTATYAGAVTFSVTLAEVLPAGYSVIVPLPLFAM